MSSATTQTGTFTLYLADTRAPGFMRQVEDISYHAAEPLDPTKVFGIFAGPQLPWREAIDAARRWADQVEFNLLEAPADRLDGPDDEDSEGEA